MRIYKTYGDVAVERVRENPYRLALDIHGIGFKTADMIAQRLGIPKDSLLRAQAGVRHVLQELSGDGHCAAVHTRLVEMSEKLLEIPAATIEEAIAAELVEENLVEEAIQGQPCLFLTPLHRAEVGVAQRLQALLDCAPPWGRIDPDKAIPWVEEKTGLVLSPSQRTAVAEAVNGKVTVITGGPGVGKTTVVNSLLRILRARGVGAAVCADRTSRQVALRMHGAQGSHHSSRPGVRSQGLRVQAGTGAFP